MAAVAHNLTILLAEDDDGHATLIERNLVRAGLRARILRARNGIEALNVLTNSFDARAAAQMVVLLDIRMPEMDGTEVLRHIKSDDRTAAVPVYVLTTSDDQREVERCFRLGCNAYIMKPVAYESFVETIGMLAGFLRISKVPVGASDPA
jgi:CheY-like chemotaxis protein